MRVPKAKRHLLFPFMGKILAVFFCALVQESCTPNPGPTTPTSPSTSSSVTLPINPVAQQQPLWCWLASGQMVFQYYGIPPINPISYQCGIIAAFEGPNSVCWISCGACNFGAGSSLTIVPMLQQYSLIATNGTKELSAVFAPNMLPPQQIQTEIQAKRPVLAGINPGQTFAIFGNSEHLVVIVGYETSNGQFSLVVNDPFPYEAVGSPDPYLAVGATLLRPGQYLIAYDGFTQGLLWNTSWYNVAFM